MSLRVSPNYRDPRVVAHPDASRDDTAEMPQSEAGYRITKRARG